MTDHYQTLGVAKNATQDEIKRAYRKLASQHHPDRGGDTTKFQEIQVAYDTLSDPEKRAQYDNPAPQFDNGFTQYGGMPPGFEDIIRQTFGGGFGGFSPFGDFARQSQPRNRTMSIQTTISLEDAFSGKDLIANVTLPTGRDQLLEVKIPAGIVDGTTLRLPNMGDDLIKQAPRGDINLTVHIEPHKTFQRQGDDLIYKLHISCIDAMTGKQFNVPTLDGKTLELTIRPGTQHGQILAAAGYGMPNMRDNRLVGRLLIEVNVAIPTNLTDYQKQLLQQHFN